MLEKRGFTLIELLVVVAIIALLMAILIPTLNRAREQGKRAACLSNLKQLTLGWIMYADDNDDKIVCASTNLKEGWVRWVVRTAPEEEKIHGVRSGLFYPYCPVLKLYKCPTGLRGEVVTYAIMDRMNGYTGIPGTRNLMVYRRMQIKRPIERAVFLDEGFLTSNSYTVWYEKEEWFDPPPVRHGDGTNFSFADGHSEYWKWRDKRTLEWNAQAVIPPYTHRCFSGIQPGNPDLHRVQRAVWGKLGYTPSDEPSPPSE